MPLNPEQRRAVATRKGAYACVAIPGSGKTAVFVARARDILAEGCPPEKFLGLTFTKEAAKEFERRSGYKPGPNKPKIFRTFHGWALDFVVRECASFPYTVQKWPLLTPGEQYGILLPILKHTPRKVKYHDIVSAISQFKRLNLSPQQAMREAEGEFGSIYAGAYLEYEQRCKALGKMDFDSLLVESVRLLETRPDILARYQPDYLQCDEAQDNDAAQWRLIQLLAARTGNVFCVGDPNQNMYTWRGSEADGLTTKFDERFQNVQRLVLPQNYRSTKSIVAYCESIAPVPTPMRTDNDQGVPIMFNWYATEQDEAAAILDGLIDPVDSAILTRTNRQLAAFEKLCGERGIKYRLLGKSGFFNQDEVKNTLAFAQYYVSPSDHIMKLIIRSPYDCSRFIKKDALVESLEDMQRGSFGARPDGFHRLLGKYYGHDLEQNNRVRELHEKLWECKHRLDGRSAQDALRNIITHFGILHHYEDKEDAIDNSPADNIRALLKMAESKANLFDFVHGCLKAKQASRSTAKRLTLSTVHQSKGKEWANVFVAGVNQDVLPHKNGDPEEERRIFFVASSRAAKRLSISCNGASSPYIRKSLPVQPGTQGAVDLLDTMYRLAVTGKEVPNAAA